MCRDNLRMPWNTKLESAIGAARLTQKALSDLVCRSESAVSRWCSGTSQPRFNELLIILEATGVSADWLLDDSYPEKPIIWRERPTVDQSGIVRELAPGPPSPRKAKPQGKRPDPPAAGTAKAGGPRSPRPGGGKADVDVD